MTAFERIRATLEREYPETKLEPLGDHAAIGYIGDTYVFCYLDAEGEVVAAYLAPAHAEQYGKDTE